MAKAGDVLEHPVTRERLVFRKCAGDTNGQLLEGELIIQPGGFVAVEHIHPLQEERFEVISGTLQGRVGGKEVNLGPTEVLVVAAGTPHVWWNSGTTEMRVRGQFRPALRTENFFEALFGLAQDGKVSSKTGLPNPLRMAVLMRGYRNELILAKPARGVQTVLFGLLAPIGRLLGYRADYPYPHNPQPRPEVHAT